ncbi:MAG TPA: YidC/Oxa1 family insertase periplasmic-domain containing protein [Lacipirellulaceae bacterium]|nr:YidC/Oxa1 family insertase periplasmic-domain containing protein [Lacipirellulaceae bacterium]
MDRRFLLFVMLSMLLLFGNSLWNARNAPKRPPAAAPAVPAGQDPATAEGAADVDAPEAPAADAGSNAAGARDATGENADAGAAAEPEAPAEFVTLGSVDPASPYRMLVTLTNEGAAVRRLELSSPRYRDVHDRSGYLGRLELARDAEPGLLVRAVGAGTPADVAGLRVGDRLIAAGPAGAAEMTPVAAVDEFENLLDRLRPGRELRIKVRRDGAEQELSATLGRRPLEVIRPESENVLLRGAALPADFEEPPSFLLTLQQIGERTIAAPAAEIPGVDLLEAAWQITERTADAVTFERRLPGEQLTLRKRDEVAKLDDPATADADAPAYHLNLTVSIVNDAAGEGAKPREVSYRLEGANGLPIEGWWYATKVGRNWGAAGIRDVNSRFFNADPVQQAPPTIAEGEAQSFDSGSLAYAGVDAQYFAAATMLDKKDPSQDWIATVEPRLVGPAPDRRTGGAKYANVSYRVTSEAAAVAPGETITHRYKVFAGPKRPDLLARYQAADQPAYSLRDFVYYGWFGGVARAMVGLLHVFYGWIGNYGIAIVMLTVLVRGCMFPISRGQARSMAKMQELKPEMERIKEKFKGDQQKQAKAMQDLYRKNNVNPLAGCLPMLIQLPVFVGLYRGLAVDLELRQASLFGPNVPWCSNLAAPDMFYNWSGFMPRFITSGEGLFGLGPYLNVLPLITIGLFMLQQKLFMPPAADEQAALQQKIMKYMMVFMGLLFYKVPSGLCLYFIASSLWGIAERKLVPPVTAPAAAAGGAPSPPSRWSLASLGAQGGEKPAADKRAGSNGQSGGSRSKSKRRK